MEDARHDAGPRGWAVSAGPVSLGLIATLQVAFLAWWLVTPMPNTGNLGKGVYRGVLLMRAIPQVVPGVTFPDSGLGQMVAELRHVENLPERVPIVLAAALILAAGVGLGDLALRLLRVRSGLSPYERVPLAFGLGMIGLALATLFLGRWGLLHAWPVRGGLIVLVAAAILGRSDPSTATTDREAGRGAKPRAFPVVAFLLLVGPFLVFMLLAAMVPKIEYDALEYHLQGPKEYYQAGRIAFLPHNVYASMPSGVEMLHLLGMVVLGDWWRGALVGQVLVMLHAPAAAALIGLAAGRLASPRAGWFAAAVYLTTPWVFRLAAIPFVEGPLLYYHAALIWAVLWADSPRRWAVVGLLAGGAMACKYPALISAVIPFGVLAIRTRRPKVVLGFSLGVAVAIGPWLVKNVVDTGNPVYPLAHPVFGGRHWSLAREAKWQKAHGPKPPTWSALRDGLLDVAGRSDSQSALYAMLAPLALLRRGSRKSSLVLWGYVAYLFATWFLLTHRLDRFWLPALAPLAILAGQGADWTRGRAWSAILGAILLATVAANFALGTTALTAFNEWTGSLVAQRVEVPSHVNPPLARLDTELPRGARPLLIGQAAVFHLEHPAVYNTVFDEEIFETLARDRPPDEVRRRLISRGITHIYVDWTEILRHRKPGGYGFTDFVRPEEFARLVRAGILEPMPPPGPDRDLYRVVTEAGR